MPPNMVDRISMLQDEVLCHILSFLPTQEAVATSILSKRWRHLWTSVPALDYDDRIYLRNGESPLHFEKLVYATILARDHRQPITKFHLKYDVSGSDRSHADVNAWLKAVIPRGVENLDIELSAKRMISLSCCIWRCTTLVALNLTGSLSLNVSSVELPSLKSLHLSSVQFTRHRNLMELLLGSPILEDLKVNDIYYVHEHVHEGSFWKQEFKCLSKLVRADLRCSDNDHNDIPLKAICNAEFLCITKYQLAKVVPEFPNLKHVVLDRVSWDSVLEMLKNYPKLQVLELVSQDRPREEEDFTNPQFVPECLTSQFRKCSFKYCFGTEIELRFAKYIMQSSTTLQMMTICSPHFFSFQAKQKMLNELALCPRRSALCKLSFV